jgi:hypothetical protein
MNSAQAEAILEERGVHADPAHLAAAASGVSALLEATAGRFAGLPLEAEPSGFQAEQRRSAP